MRPIFLVNYTSVSLKKYFAKNLDLCQPRNLLFDTALTVTKLQFGGFYCSFVTVNAVLSTKFFGSQISKFLVKYFFGLKYNLQDTYVNIGFTNTF